MASAILTPEQMVHCPELLAALPRRMRSGYPCFDRGAVSWGASGKNKLTEGASEPSRERRILELPAPR